MEFYFGLCDKNRKVKSKKKIKFGKKSKKIVKKKSSSSKSKELVLYNKEGSLTTYSKTGSLTTYTKTSSDNPIRRVVSLIDNMYDMIGGKDINLIKDFGDNMMKYTILEDGYLIHSIDTDDKSGLAMCKQRLTNFSKLYSLTGDISTLNLIKDEGVLKLENFKNEGDIMVFKEESENIIGNINELSLIFRSSKSIIDFFSKSSNKYSYVDLINVLERYTDSMYSTIEEFSTVVEENYIENPSKYSKDYLLVKEYMQKLEYINSSLNDYSKKLEYFNNSYINSMNRIVDNCLEGNYDKSKTIEFIKNLTNGTLGDITREFLHLEDK